MEGRVAATHNYNYTVGPLIMEPPNKGHNRNNLSIKDTSHSTNTFSTSKERKPLYKGKNSWSQRVLYSEVPVYIIISPFK